ncbi:thermonuclease family protein [Methylomagnum sp.]
MWRGGLAVLLSILGGAVWAEDWMGRVVAVHDGDTLRVLRYGEAVQVRLDEIDAPELGQDYGQESRQSLARLCLGMHAEVRVHGQDKYDRVLGRVRCAGTDANAEQIRQGSAWFYAQYSHDAALRDLEAAARARGIGLWASRRPTPPWDFRHANKAEPHWSGPSASQHSRAQSGRCGAKKTCGDMTNCEEAMYYLDRCGLTKLDRNRDGVPCESLCR